MAAGLGAAGAAIGMGSAIAEIIGELGDIAETVITNLKEVVLYETHIRETHSYKPVKSRGKLTERVVTRHIKITAWDLVVAYAIGRVLGLFPSIFDWPEILEEAKDKWKKGLWGWPAFVWEDLTAPATGGSPGGALTQFWAGLYQDSMQ